MGRKSETEEASRAPVRSPERPIQRRVSSAELLRGSRRLLIEHEGVEYQLQLTRQGKLILTK